MGGVGVGVMGMSFLNLNLGFSTGGDNNEIKITERF